MDWGCLEAIGSPIFHNNYPADTGRNDTVLFHPSLLHLMGGMMGGWLQPCSWATASQNKYGEINKLLKIDCWKTRLSYHRYGLNSNIRLCFVGFSPLDQIVEDQKYRQALQGN